MILTKFMRFPYQLDTRLLMENKILKDWKYSYYTKIEHRHASFEDHVSNSLYRFGFIID